METSSTPTYLALIDDDMQQLNQVIINNLTTDVTLISQVTQHIIFAGGKRLRPALMLLMSRALGYTGQQQFNLAAVIELIHTSTLLHDDVVDESSLRRGKPTANSLFGNSASVLVGDFLYSRSFQMMVSANNMRIMQILSDTTNVIASGEVMQLLNVHNSDVSQQDYLKVIQAKTAKLFEASTLIAAVLNQTSKEIEQICADYGNNLGIAFQIIDDILDYDGNSTELGKNLGDDLREGKITLPIILALQQTDNKQLIKDCIENGGDQQQLAKILDLIKQCGALEQAKQIAAYYAQIAIDCCAKLPKNEYSTALLELAQNLLLRKT